MNKAILMFAVMSLSLGLGMHADNYTPRLPLFKTRIVMELEAIGKSHNVWKNYLRGHITKMVQMVNHNEQVSPEVNDAMESVIAALDAWIKLANEIAPQLRQVEKREDKIIVKQKYNQQMLDQALAFIKSINSLGASVEFYKGIDASVREAYKHEFEGMIGDFILHYIVMAK